MSAIVAPRTSAVPPIKRDIALTAAFWLFSYFFLALRKVLSTDDLSVALSAQRMIAISIGAFAYWLVLKQIESGSRIRLRTVIAWVVAGALGMMVVRLGLIELMADSSVALGRSLRWTLTWSAYFAMWVVGAVAYFAPVSKPAAAAARAATPLAIPVAAASPSSESEPTRQGEAAHVDELSQLIEAIAIEAARELSPTDRKTLAAKVLNFGRYEIIGDDAWSKSLSVRASFAWRLATRLSRDY
jgi:hypothetical protein